MLTQMITFLAQLEQSCSLQYSLGAIVCLIYVAWSQIVLVNYKHDE